MVASGVSRSGWRSLLSRMVLLSKRHGLVLLTGRTLKERKVMNFVSLIYLFSKSHDDALSTVTPVFQPADNPNHREETEHTCTGGRCRSEETPLVPDSVLFFGSRCLREHCSLLTMELNAQNLSGLVHYLGMTQSMDPVQRDQAVKFLGTGRT